MVTHDWRRSPRYLQERHHPKREVL